MNGSYLPVNGRSGQDQVLRWLGNNAETWSESYTFAEDTDQEDTITWLRRNGLVIEEEDWTDYLKGAGGGALAGAGTGAVAGPYGALAGALLGAGLGALQTYQQQQQRQQPAPPPQQQQPSPPPSQRSSPAPATPTPASPQTGGGAARDSAQSPQALQQLVQLLPLLTQLLSQQQSKQKAAGEASGDDVEGRESGDYVPDEAFLDQFIDRGIENPIPRENLGQESEDAPTPEYPLASRFVPAASNNYRRYYRSRMSPNRPINRIVIHITDGNSNINGTIAWFGNPAAGVSAHYIVGQDGEVVQMVQHNDVAYHAHSANSDSIGIEHVARAPGTFSRTDRGLSPTEGQYCSSAALVRWLCERYSIPMDRVHILGHSEADPSTTHTGCPNSVWDWSYYMSLVTSGRCSPRPSLP